MSGLNNLLSKNKEWVKSVTESDPNFFKRLAEGQEPEYLWIGCSDSRISPTMATGLLPGELFVHRNIANLVVHSDMNCLSVIQYAIKVLKIKHIMVCGHYGCGGVKAALEEAELGLIDNWLRHIQDIAKLYEERLNEIPDETKRLNKLCELNVIEQVLNVSETTFVQKAWRSNQGVAIHGWIYDLSEGIIRDLGVSVENVEQMRDLRHKFWSVNE